MKDKHIALIAMLIYGPTCYFKKSQMFAIYMRDIQYCVKTKAEVNTNLKNVIFPKYFDIFDVFLTKTIILFFEIKNLIKKFSYEKRKNLIIQN